MERENEQKLTSRIHRELRQLPPRKAPPTLMPRVLAAIEAQAHQPWWKKSWANWPGWMRVLFLAVTLPTVVAVLYAGFLVGGGFSFGAMANQVGEWFGFLAPVLDLGAALGNALVVLARSGGQVLLWSLVAVGLAAYLACFGLGTFCYRVAVNKI